MCHKRITWREKWLVFLCYRKDDDTREWVRDIWNTWFDEVFPPTPEESDYEEEEELTEEQIAEREEEEKKKKRYQMTVYLD